MELQCSYSQLEICENSFLNFMEHFSVRLDPVGVDVHWILVLWIRHRRTW